MTVQTIFSIEEVQEKSRELVHQLKSKDAMSAEELDKLVTKMLNLRGNLLDRFKPVINMISIIEDEIKAAKLPAGNYGINFPLKISNSQSKVIFDDKVFSKLEAMGENPIQFAKVDTKNALVKALLEECADELTEAGNVVKKHYFK